MRATRQYSCCCGCNTKIQPGDQMTVVGGEFFHLSHTTGDCFEAAGVETPKRGFIEHRREVEQKSIFDLPLFDTCPTEQTRLF